MDVGAVGMPRAQRRRAVSARIPGGFMTRWATCGSGPVRNIRATVVRSGAVQVKFLVPSVPAVAATGTPYRGGCVPPPAKVSGRRHGAAPLAFVWPRIFKFLLLCFFVFIFIFRTRRRSRCVRFSPSATPASLVCGARSWYWSLSVICNYDFDSHAGVRSGLKDMDRMWSIWQKITTFFPSYKWAVNFPHSYQLQHDF